MKVYIASGESGCYSDYHTWIVGVGATVAAAKRLVEQNVHDETGRNFDYVYDIDGELVRGDDGEPLREYYPGPTLSKWTERSHFDKTYYVASLPVEWRPVDYSITEWDVATDE